MVKILFSFVNKLINDTENLNINKSSDSSPVASPGKSMGNPIQIISYWILFLNFYLFLFV